jgi:hypothetical protein
LRIRLRSRILWKHDLETAEICWANDRFLSQMTPRLRVESTGESMTLLGRWIVGVLSLESCCDRLQYQTENVINYKAVTVQISTLIRKVHKKFSITTAPTRSEFNNKKQKTEFAKKHIELLFALITCNKLNYNRTYVMWPNITTDRFHWALS